MIPEILVLEIIISSRCRFLKKNTKHIKSYKQNRMNQIQIDKKKKELRYFSENQVKKVYMKIRRRKLE